jgi:methyl-galactoside transport system substrate-binding protein
MTRRSGAFAMATASMLLLSAVPTMAQDTSPAAGDALPVAECVAPSEPIGVAVFRFDNDYLSLIREAIQAAADEKGAKVDIVDGQNAQPTQNEQIDLFISKNVPAMAVNQVDRELANVTLDKAKAADIPVVFFNKEPLPEVLTAWDKAYYVGAKAEESGIMQGQLVIDYWAAHPEADKNGDGIIQYVMLSGPADHQDAQIRTVESIKAINAAGLQTQALAEQIGDWNVPLAQEQMGAIYAQHGDAIEFVLANNDPMALGAIEALKANGYFGADGKIMPVVGVDATAAALDSMRSGELYGTVLNDAVNQARATFNLACVLAGDGVPTAENTGYTIDGQYVWVPYVPVVPEDLG